MKTARKLGPDCSSSQMGLATKCPQPIAFDPRIQVCTVSDWSFLSNYAECDACLWQRQRLFHYCVSRSRSYGYYDGLRAHRWGSKQASCNSQRCSLSLLGRESQVQSFSLSQCYLYCSFDLSRFVRMSYCHVKERA